VFAGVTAIDTKVGAVTVRLVVPLIDPQVAVMVMLVVDVTELVFTVKVAVVAPAATVTFVGTVATAVLLLVSVTTAPPDGAAVINVTVPVEVLPPVTDAGFRLRARPGWMALLRPITNAAQ
jgi:hypothetical protein